MKNFKMNTLFLLTVSGVGLSFGTTSAQAKDKLSNSAMSSISGQTKPDGPSCEVAGHGSCVANSYARNGKCVLDLPLTWHACVTHPGTPPNSIKCDADVITCWHSYSYPLDSYGHRVTPTDSICSDTDGLEELTSDYYEKTKGCG